MTLEQAKTLNTTLTETQKRILKGSTLAFLAKVTKELGVKTPRELKLGRRGVRNFCTVSNTLRACGEHDWSIYVMTSCMLLQVIDTEGERRSFCPPASARVFINAFDGGQYPELQELDEGDRV